jgi:hypothetical protein
MPKTLEAYLTDCILAAADKAPLKNTKNFQDYVLHFFHARPFHPETLDIYRLPLFMELVGRFQYTWAAISDPANLRHQMHLSASEIAKTILKNTPQPQPHPLSAPAPRSAELVLEEEAKVPPSGERDLAPQEQALLPYENASLFEDAFRALKGRFVENLNDFERKKLADMHAHQTKSALYLDQKIAQFACRSFWNDFLDTFANEDGRQPDYAGILQSLTVFTDAQSRENNLDHETCCTFANHLKELITQHSNHINDPARILPDMISLQSVPPVNYSNQLYDAPSISVETLIQGLGLFHRFASAENIQDWPALEKVYTDVCSSEINAEHAPDLLDLLSALKEGAIAAGLPSNHFPAYLISKIDRLLLAVLSLRILKLDICTIWTQEYRRK